MEYFTQQEVIDIMKIPPGRLRYWERLGLVEPAVHHGRKQYTLQDLVCMRTVLRLVGDRVPAARLRAVVTRLRQDDALATKKPLLDLRLESLGRHVVFRHDGRLSEPVSGQQIMDLDATGGERVLTMFDRNEDQWLAIAMRAEKNPKQWSEAIHAYQQVVSLKPDCWEAYINLGTLYYKMEQMQQAEASYQAALRIAPKEAVVHFNLANVLDEMGQTVTAASHLCETIDLQPDYADAHYNLALLLEKLGQSEQASVHWRTYLKLDRESEWAHVARGHLTRTGADKVVPLRR